jgi:hypothetical protein
VALSFIWRSMGSECQLSGSRPPWTAEVQKKQEKFSAKIARSNFGRLQGGPQDDPQGCGSQIPP